MVLSDRDIIDRIDNGSLVIEPYDESNVEPASVDLRLGDDFKRALPVSSTDLDTDDYTGDEIQWHETEGSVEICPGDFVLATTHESVKIPTDLVAEVTGRSSLGRLGVSIHQTAGFIDPGFEGEITLELSNHGPVPLTFHAEQRICQIVFTELSSEAVNPYGHSGSQYQNQTGATESGMNFD